ncbi:MAG: branched chain amino acid aminotransferase [Thermotogae bacterium]|nr:branched chain amino acid aminotransferase [Thermotogota bacterium]
MHRKEKGEEVSGYVPWDDAKIHVLSHVIHYSSGVFEGIRGYLTRGGVAIFRGRDHYRRLVRSAKIYRMFPEHYAPRELRERGKVSQKDLVSHFMKLTKELIRKNDLCRKAKEVKDEGKMNNPFVYIRPVIYRGYDVKDDPILKPPLGVNPLGNPVEWFIATFLWDDYLGKEAIENGANVITSAWAKNSPSTTPFMAKGASNYATGQLAKMESVLSAFFKDYDVLERVKKGQPITKEDLFLAIESVQLTTSGYVAEGTGENIFVVMYENGDPGDPEDPKKVKIYTPPISASILPGITRDSIIRLAKDEGYEVIETMIPRELLYIADEVFFTGTAAEVTPISTVDGIPVGKGKPGRVTLHLRRLYTEIARGERPDKYGWVDFVEC